MRHRLGETRTITIKVKMDEAEAKEFGKRCEAGGETRSEVMRRLIDRWMRQTAEIARLKGRSQCSQKD